MDQSEEQLDYEEEDRRLQSLTEAEETIPEEEEYEDLYRDVNVGFISPPDLDLNPNPSPAAENQTAVAESLRPDPPKDYREANDGQQGFGALRQRAGQESNTGPAGTPVSAVTSTPSRRGNCDYAGRDSGENGGGGGGGGGVVFVGELHWWTTDAELEASLSEYGMVESIEFSEERASGKCRGSCEVHFYDSACARACKAGMNGRVFNGRPCVVSLPRSRPHRKMGDGLGYKGKGGNHQDSQPRGMMNDSGGGKAGGGGGIAGSGVGGGGKAGSSGGEGGRGRHYGRSSGGLGAHGGQGRGQGGQGGAHGGQGRGQGRGQGGHGRGRAGKGMGGGPGSVSGGGQYGQVYFGSIGGGTMPPPMRNQGFDLAFGGQMGRGGGGGGGGGYAGFAAQASHAPSHFPAIVPSFSPVGPVGFAGVAPHVNPAFFGQGMSGNGMGMVPSGSGMEGHHAGMWTDSVWGGDGHGRRMGESGYGEDAGSEYAYAEKNHERGGRSSVQRIRDRSIENDRMGTSEKRQRNNREADWSGGRDRYRDNERVGHHDQWERGRNWESERTSRSRGQSHAMEEADRNAFSREAEYAKRRH